MPKIELSDLYDMPYGVQVVSALRQTLTEMDRFSCLGTPKCYHMFLYLDGCRAEYTFSDGSTLAVREGSVVFAPVGSTYRVHFYPAGEGEGATVGINLLLSDAGGAPLLFGDGVRALRGDGAPMGVLFAKIARYSAAATPCFGRIRSLADEILFRLSEECRRRRTDACRHAVDMGVRLLESEECDALSVEDIARRIGVSEVHFRRLFRAGMGMSPTEYRTCVRVSRAKALLKQNILSLTEIAARTGFASTSYFIKVFRQRTGVTPAAYRAAFENEIRKMMP